MIDWPSFIGGMIAVSALWLVSRVCTLAFSRRSTPDDSHGYDGVGEP